jgi:hypothetical protein
VSIIRQKKSMHTDGDEDACEYGDLALVHEGFREFPLLSYRPTYRYV